MPSGMVIIQKRRILIFTNSLLDDDKDNACYDYTQGLYKLKWMTPAKILVYGLIT